MGKYLPVIKTAACGSMTRAAQLLGCTQPSLGDTINNIERELGVKLFDRDRQGGTLTQPGASLLPIMAQIEAMEERLRETALVSRGELLRVGIFSGVDCQWIPAALGRFCEEHPGVTIKLTHGRLDREPGGREQSLDCCFCPGRSSGEWESVALYKDPYYLVVNRADPMAELDMVSVWDVVGKAPFIPNSESAHGESPMASVYRAFEQDSLVEVRSPENQMALAMVNMGLGVTILPELDLVGRDPGPNLRAVPLEEGFTRTVSLLCPREPERSPLTESFLQIVQGTVEAWSRENPQGASAWKKPAAAAI